MQYLFIHVFMPAIIISLFLTGLVMVIRGIIIYIKWRKSGWLDKEDGDE